jgi:hypothetical protein
VCQVCFGLCHYLVITIGITVSEECAVSVVGVERIGVRLQGVYMLLNPYICILINLAR